jgi:hypothetical protein
LIHPPAAGILLRCRPGEILMRATARCRQLGFIAAICAAPWLAGCGRPQTAPLSEGREIRQGPGGQAPAEASFEEQTEQKLEPLTPQDVALYLDVMRAAAERVAHPAPGDRDILQAARRLVSAGAPASSGRRVPTPEDAKLLERATLVAMRMDQIVAEEKELDGRAYRGIAAAIESAIAPGTPAAASVGNTPAPTQSLTPLQKRLNEVNAANAGLLAPYRDEIQKMLAVVRNPANLPH